MKPFFYIKKSHKKNSKKSCLIKMYFYQKTVYKEIQQYLNFHLFFYGSVQT